MKTDTLFWILLFVALIVGAIIGRIDTSPGWDDTGISVGMILVSTAILGFTKPNHAWVLALAVGIWIPLFNIVSRGNYGSAAAILFALFGAYIGAAIKWLFVGKK